MNEVMIHIPVKECRYEELGKEDQVLVEAAKGMTRRSYAPYSRFHVGAAILLDDGTIVNGANQENVAYPSGLCAERTACYQAGALYPGKAFRKIAIAAWTLGGAENDGGDYGRYFQRNPISPCGACRQALLEYENLAGKPIEVILYGTDRVLIFPSVASTLPLCFTEF